MTDKPIETRIRDYYQSGNGEWLAEKGKIKEAKLLKEACETIEQLRRKYATSEQSYYRLLQETSTKRRELEEREKMLEKREARFEDRKASFIRDFEKLV